MPYLNQILLNQFEAALAMLRQCIEACPPEHWEGKIANATFRQVAYHTLFFVDVYLSRGEAAFELRELHRRGGDEREDVVSDGLSQAETLQLLAICLQRVRETLAVESQVDLEGPSGFVRRKFTRGELHIYSLRHVQHHGAQLSAYLRRVAPERFAADALPWIGSGWK